MGARMPDRNLFSFPRFHRPDGNRFRRHQGNISAAGGAGILGDGQWVEVHDAGWQSAIFGGGWRLVLVLAFAARWIIEGPMFDVPLPSLHHGATHTFPRF